MWLDISTSDADMRDDLVDRLRTLGIRYLGGGHFPAPSASALAMPVESLMLGLVHSPDARLRTALVALHLGRPDLAPVAVRLAETVDDAQVARSLRVGVLAAAALQRTWAFSLDLYLPGWQSIDAEVPAAQLGVPPPGEDYGRATLIALDRLLGADNPVPPDYRGAWEDVGRHVLDDLRQEAADHGA